MPWFTPWIPGHAGCQRGILAGMDGSLAWLAWVFIAVVLVVLALVVLGVWALIGTIRRNRRDARTRGVLPPTA